MNFTRPGLARDGDGDPAALQVVPVEERRQRLADECSGSASGWLRILGYSTKSRPRRSA
jgi:hypothetical protein